MTYEQALNKLDETVIRDLELKIVLTNALEKQIPKKPIPIFGTYSNTVISCTCPNCGHEDLGNNEFEYDYCESCGQALDWGDK